MQLRLMLASLQREIEIHFESIGCPEGAVTASALSQARRKLRYTAFIELNEGYVLRRFYGECPTVRRWRGYVVTAVDGSTLALPRHKALEETFGGMQPRLGQFRPKARLLERYDVLNHLVWEALMNPYNQGERTVLKAHQKWDQQGITGLKAQEVITLYDRGFASVDLLQWHHEQGSPFVLRLPSRWKAVMNFVRSGRREEVLLLKVRQKQWQLRLIRVDLPDGEPEVLVTNLMDSQQFPAKCFGQLYRLRWGVETGYKLLKCRAQLEQWSSRHEEGIRQDLHAKVMMLNFAAVLSSGSQKDIAQRSARQLHHQEIKHGRQMNWTHAVAALRRHLSDLLLKGRETAWRALERLNTCFWRTLNVVRPDRKAPRKSLSKRAPNPAYKSL